MSPRRRDAAKWLLLGLAAAAAGFLPTLSLSAFPWLVAVAGFTVALLLTIALLHLFAGFREFEEWTEAEWRRLTTKPRAALPWGRR